MTHVMTEEMKEQLFDHPVVFQTEKLHFEAYLWRVMLEFFSLIQKDTSIKLGRRIGHGPR